MWSGNKILGSGILILQIPPQSYHTFGDFEFPLSNNQKYYPPIVTVDYIQNPPNTTHFCSHITHRGGEIFSYKLNVECARWIVNIFQIFFSWLITAHSLHLWPGSWGWGREEVASRCRSWDRQIRGKNVIISGRARMQFHVNTKSRDCCSLRGISPSKSASGVALAKIYGRQ